jgi:endo-1,4-beta-xylanase
LNLIEIKQIESRLWDVKLPVCESVASISAMGFFTLVSKIQVDREVIVQLMKIPFFPAILLMATPCLAALPLGGVDLAIVQESVKAWGGAGGSSAMVPVVGRDFHEAMQITVAQADPENPWNAQWSSRFSGSVKNGDKLLVTYAARCVSGGKGLVAAKVQLAQPSSPMVGMAQDAKIGPEWNQVYQPFLAKLDTPEGQGELVFFLGERAQTVEIANVRVLNYGANIELSTLPHQKQTYEGREPDALWRQQALARIEQHRKADFSIKLSGADGQPVSKTKVVVELDRHEFGFGSCVTRGLLTKEGPDGDRYREIVRKTFSRVVFENDFKPDTFPHEETGRAELEKSLAWLESEGISVRGHYLMQEAVDGWSRERLADPAKLRSDLMESVRERITMAGSRVVEWDVINHPVAWQGAELFAQKGPPLDTLGMEVFQEARRLTTLPLCINEDQIFRPGPQQDKTYELLEKLRRNGVRVDGFGNQAHFHSSFLPSPDYLLEVTDRFAAVVPKQVVTEFDIVTNGDDALAADYLRDCLIACFSHPAYDGFLLWGFWEGSHWLPEAALWKKDWSVKPIGTAWEEWVGNRWHTRLTLETDAEGKLVWRGFKGTYRVTVDGATTAPLKPGSKESPVEVEVR